MSATRTIALVAIAASLLAATFVAYAGLVAATPSASDPWDHAWGPTYNVTFNETGLAADTNWSVSVFGGWSWNLEFRGFWGWGHGFGRFHGSNTTSVVLALANGTYWYHVNPVPGYNVTSNASGTLTVSGASPAAVNVTFAAIPTYTVTFSETGLPSGTNWSVGLSRAWGWGDGFWGGRNFATTNDTSLSFALPNGSYFYRAATIPGYGVQGGSWGTFNVSGAAVSIDLVFAPLATFNVTFNETGLPAGTNWTVSVFSWQSWGFHPYAALSETTNGTNLTFALTNGTYGFFVSHVPGYVATNNSTGFFVVDGASPAEIQVTFAACSHWMQPVAVASAAPAEA